VSKQSSVYIEVYEKGRASLAQRTSNDSFLGVEKKKEENKNEYIMEKKKKFDLSLRKFEWWKKERKKRKTQFLFLNF